MHLGRSVRAGLRSERLDVRADEHGGNVAAAELRSLRKDAERALLQLAAVMLEKHEDAGH